MSYLNSTDNLSFFSITENNIEISSYFSPIGDYSENRPNLSEILKFQDMIQNSKQKERNKESKKAEHTAWSIDSIERKIEIHFLNFVISFLNTNYVVACFGYPKFTFLKFSHSEKNKSFL